MQAQAPTPLFSVHTAFGPQGVGTQGLTFSTATCTKKIILLTSLVK